MILQHHNCFCGNSTDNDVKVADSVCDESTWWCNNDPNLPCGNSANGIEYASIYRAGECFDLRTHISDALIQTCAHVHSEYVVFLVRNINIRD